MYVKLPYIRQHEDIVRSMVVLLELIELSESVRRIDM